jgi:hypothetical protein
LNHKPCHDSDAGSERESEGHDVFRRPDELVHERIRVPEDQPLQEPDAELHGGLVLTLMGAQMLQRWTEYVLPLKEEHVRYGELWRSVTGLEG